MTVYKLQFEFSRWWPTANGINAVPGTFIDPYEEQESWWWHTILHANCTGKYDVIMCIMDVYTILSTYRMIHQHWKPQNQAIASPMWLFLTMMTLINFSYPSNKNYLWNAEIWLQLYSYYLEATTFSISVIIQSYMTQWCFFKRKLPGYHPPPCLNQSHLWQGTILKGFVLNMMPSNQNC